MGVNHDHHEGEKTVVLFEESDHCEQPAVPCNDANEELPDLQFSIPSESQKQFYNSLIGIIPAPAPVFKPSLNVADFEPLLLYESIRLSPVSRRVVFCRFHI